ncbi:MAG TPA: prepilin-type N-terminal cleavage/methylation domain-containing protein [Nitrospira sp.]|nr:prepilin-type N-terminal cleavage/methylation domain-containing protein [Nitrospira sp.]
MRAGTAQQGFTLIEILICLAILSILAVLGGLFHLDSVEKAKAVEATIALAEVVRLEQLYQGNTGTYSSDLSEIGFSLPSPLQYHQLFVQVQKDGKGWSYIAMAMPLNGVGTGNQGGWAVAQSPGGQFKSNLPGVGGSAGPSACGIWTGWESMEGGHIEGEVSLQSGATSNASPCGVRVVNHGKK